MAGNLNSGMCSPLCSDVCAFYLPQGLTLLSFFICVFHTVPTFSDLGLY